MVEGFIAGKLYPQGSKRLVQPRGAARPRMIEASPKVYAWRRAIRDQVAALRDTPPFPGQWTVELQFHFRRPKRLEVRCPIEQDNIDCEHISRPDLDKLARAVLDACTGVLWDDDSQVQTLVLSKRYGDREGVTIRAREGVHV